MKTRMPIGILAVTAAACCAWAAQGPRLKAVATAEKSAPGYGPELAVDGDEATLWIANLKAVPENNRVWFQLDLGSVKQVARLRWIAAQNTPYPASAPKEYRVLVSRDGARFTPVAVPPVEGANEPTGDVLLNTDARYVRLETTRVNDGSGWALGLREIWVTEGRDTSAGQRGLRPRVTSRDGAVRLDWTLPAEVKAARLKLYRTEAPKEKPAAPLATLPGTARDYLDPIPNWTPRYYRLEAVGSDGKTVLESDLAAAVARPTGRAAAPVETFAFWYEPYRPSTGPDPSIKHIGDAPFVIGPGFQEAAADLKKLGKGLLPYVTYYQTAGWAGTFRKEEDPEKVREKIAPVAFYRKSLRYPDSPPGFVPGVFSRPGNVEYNPRAVQYTMCPNSAAFRQMALEHARKQLAGGASGFFVDNGYEDDVAASAVCESPFHEHYYGDDLTSADAFLGMLLEVSCEVKKRDPGGVVMVNGGVPGKSRYYGLGLGDVCDGQLWESYLRSSYQTPKEHVYDWQSVYTRSVELEKAGNATPPRKMFVLSYPWDRNEAYFCYATAKLCNLPWSASLGRSDPEHKEFGGHFGTYPELVDLRLGLPVKPSEYGGKKLDEGYFREYERGVVVVNPTKGPQALTVPLGKERRYRDTFAGKDGEGASITVQLPPESGRVYLWK
jgi:hypothetical protein